MAKHFTSEFVFNRDMPADFAILKQSTNIECEVRPPLKAAWEPQSPWKEYEDTGKRIIHIGLECRNLPPDTNRLEIIQIKHGEEEIHARCELIRELYTSPAFSVIPGECHAELEFRGEYPCAVYNLPDYVEPDPLPTLDPTDDSMWYWDINSDEDCDEPYYDEYVCPVCGKEH